MVKIVVIPKPHKDHKKVESYRPIALLNTDYNILVTIFGKRLNNVIGKLIHPDQTEFLKNSQMKNNSCKVLNIIDYTLNKNIPMLLLFVDAVKAFDRLEWPLIKKMVHRMELGSNIIAWWEAIYKELQAKIRMNDLNSEPILLTRGVRQGCLLSPLLFDICLDALATAVRQDNSIAGLVCKGREFKLA